MSLLSDYQGMCQVELVDVAVELPNVNPTVLLRERGGQGRECWFPIGQADGVTLSMAWRGTPTPRPLTHELMVDIFVRFGLELDVVKITGCSGKTYLAELVVSRGGERQSISCRPSDALTLALRRPVPAPIMVAEQLMRAGSPALGSDAGGIPQFGSAWPFDTPEPETWPLPPWRTSSAEAGAEPARPSEPDWAWAAKPASGQAEPPIEAAEPGEPGEPALVSEASPAQPAAAPDNQDPHGADTGP